MSDTECRDFLAALALGDERDEGHIEACAACRRAATVLGGGLGDLAATAAAPPPATDARIRALLRGSSPRPNRPSAFALALGAVAFGGLVASARVAAGAGPGAVLLLVTAYLWLSAAAIASVLAGPPSIRDPRRAVRP